MTRNNTDTPTVADESAKNAHLPTDAAKRAGAQAGGSADRMPVKYHFDDADMDFFFVVALGWGVEGGLSVGQAFHVASQITDGDAASWVDAFTRYGDELNHQADIWLARGWQQQSAEMRFNAFASYRSAWQFSPPGKPFLDIYAKERIAFAASIGALGFPATFFETPYEGKMLPGVFIKHADANAPVILLIGGADTGFEDTFMTAGRELFERGYSVAMADLPGQGMTMVDDLFWEVEAEKPISAVVDVLIDRFEAKPGRIALMGCSLGGYFVTRAAGHEPRFGAVIASTPFPKPGQLFAAQAAKGKASGTAPATATQRNHEVLFWKAGAANPADFLARTSAMCSDPSLVTVPFLSIVGLGESPLMVAQAEQWAAAIRSDRSDLVYLDASTGADAHVQVNNRRRLAQEVSGWLGEIFAD
jgi:pimeloyl-ACP methyl ester carboxylesterase